jgi:hypothetical protein
MMTVTAIDQVNLIMTPMMPVWKLWTCTIHYGLHGGAIPERAIQVSLFSL